MFKVITKDALPLHPEKQSCHTSSQNGLLAEYLTLKECEKMAGGLADPSPMTPHLDLLP